MDLRDEVRSSFKRAHKLAKKYYDEGDTAKARVEYLKCAQFAEHLAELTPEKKAEFKERAAIDKSATALKYPYSKLLKEFLDSLKEYFDLVSLVVYGSVARGNAKKDSDIDLLIIADNLPDRYERFRIFDKAEEKILDKIKELRKEGYYIFFSPVIKSREEAESITPLYLDMVEDAVVLYDKDNFFKKIIIKLKKRLNELGAERIRLGRKWYWRLKRDYRFGEAVVIE